MEAKSLGGKEYFITFIDDKTKYCWVYVIKNKSDVFEKFKEWKTEVGIQKSESFVEIMEENTPQLNLRIT